MSFLNQIQTKKIWTLSMVFAVVWTCHGLWETSTIGLEGVINFIDVLLLLSITLGLVKFQKKIWGCSWLGFMVLEYLIGVLAKETAVEMLGALIMALFVTIPICYFFIKWTKSIWQKSHEMQQEGALE